VKSLKRTIWCCVPRTHSPFAVGDKLKTMRNLLPFTFIAVTLGRVVEVPTTANLANQVKQAAKEKGVEFKIKGLEIPNDDPIDVMLKPASALTGSTTHKGPDGTTSIVSTNELILVPADAEKRFFALLSVDTGSGETQGLIQDLSKEGKGKGKLLKLGQKKGKKIILSETDGTFVPPAWECSVVHKPGDGGGRSLAKEAGSENEESHEHGTHHNHDHDHDHRGLDEGHHHGHGMDENEDVVEAFQRMAESVGLRGAVGSLGRRLYYTDTYPNKYSYEVGLFIEYDALFSANSAGNPVSYINLLVSASNIIYEKEVDTHLSISHIEYTTRYDSASGTSSALSIQRNRFLGNSFGDGRQNVDLHHAVLGNQLGGGIAYLGVLCNKNYGFGVSANMVGSFVSLDAATVWDSMVFMHELGHNFDADHTHEFSPVVDNCGNSCSPSPPDAGGTIMSYCHLCGGIQNIGYSFGGHRNDNGVFQNDPVTVSKGFSYESKRVPQNMYQHVVATQQASSCLTPITSPPSQTSCQSNAQCDDGDPCNGAEVCSNPGPNGVCVPGTPIPCGPPTNSPVNPPVQSPVPPPVLPPTASPVSAPVGSCGSGQMQVDLSITVDYWPDETTWRIIRKSTNQIIASGGPYNADNWWVTYNIAVGCIPLAEYQFQIFDSYGDGIYSPGGYSLSVDGVLVFSVDDFGDGANYHDFGSDCSSGLKEFKMVLKTDSYGSETSFGIPEIGWTHPPSGSVLLSNTMYTFKGCFVDDCYTLNMFDSWGDGICCSYGRGYYTVWFGGVKVLDIKDSAANFGFSRTDTFGVCTGGLKAAQEDESDPPPYVSVPSSLEKASPQNGKLTEGQKRSAYMKQEKAKMDQAKKKMEKKEGRNQNV